MIIGVVQAPACSTSPVGTLPFPGAGRLLWIRLHPVDLGAATVVPTPTPGLAVSPCAVRGQRAPAQAKSAVHKAPSRHFISNPRITAGH